MSQLLKVRELILSYRWTEMYPSIYQWQESHTETNWSYFSLKYSVITLLRREWHLFYDLPSFGFSSCIRLNETILYHSAVVITPHFNICSVFGSKCHCVTRFILESILECVCERVSAWACLWACMRSHLDICFLLTEIQTYVRDQVSLSFWHIFCD